MHRPLFEGLKLLALAVAVLVIGYSGLSSFDIFGARTEAETIYGDRDTVPVVRLAPSETTREEVVDTEPIAVQIQSRLQRAGCYDGPIDGGWDSATQAAAQAFIASVHVDMRVGEPDRALLKFLYEHPTTTCLNMPRSASIDPAAPMATGSLTTAPATLPSAAPAPAVQPAAYTAPPATGATPPAAVASIDAAAAPPIGDAAPTPGANDPGAEIGFGVGLSKAGPVSALAVAKPELTAPAPPPQAAPAPVAKPDALANVELLEPAPNSVVKPGSEAVIDIGPGAKPPTAAAKQSAPETAERSEPQDSASAAKKPPARAKPEASAAEVDPKKQAKKTKTAKKTKSDGSVGDAISNALYAIGF